MADPITTTLVVASTALNVAGSISGTNDELRQLGFQADAAGQNAGISRDNAATARENARLTRLQGNAAEEAHRRALRKSLGRSAAAISQAGIGAPGTGSAGAALRQGAAEGELDALNIRYGSEMDARGELEQARAYDTEAAQYDAERLNLLRQQKSTRRSGWIRAGAAALEGVANYRSASSAATTRRVQSKMARNAAYPAPARVATSKGKVRA